MMPGAGMMKWRKTALKNLSNQKELSMSDQILAAEQKIPAQNPTSVAAKTEDGSTACPMQGKGWFKGMLGMAICCAAPLLLVAAISFFGLSLGAIASGAFSVVALLACPVGMFLMMRMMSKKGNTDG
jgi:hypothetical protein